MLLRLVHLLLMVDAALAVGQQQYVENIGEGLCLRFHKPTTVDVSTSHELIADQIKADGNTLMATAFTAVPNGQTPSTTHVRANMHSRIYRSVDAGESWRSVGEASPNCAVGSTICNSVNVSWTGPLISCAGTEACGSLPGAEAKYFDLGLLQWPSRTEGLGPRVSSSYIGVHDFSDTSSQNSHADIATIENKTVCITGLPPLTTFGCPRGVDQSPLRVSACNMLKVGTKFLLPVAVFLNNSQLEHGNLSTAGVCAGHRSALALLSSDIADGLAWEYQGIVAEAQNHETEGPNECSIMLLPATSNCSASRCQSHLAIIYRQGEASNNSIVQRQTAAYRLTTALLAENDSASRYNWSKAVEVEVSPSNAPIGEVQPASLWVTPQTSHAARSAKASRDGSHSHRILALKASRPGLTVFTSTEAAGNSIHWSHATNVADIHNRLVEDPAMHFSDAFVNSTVHVLENHGATIVALNASSFGVFYDRSVWGRPPNPARGESDSVLFMRVDAMQCSE